MLVQKFGGGILSNKNDFQRVANTIQKTKPSFVVVSAVKGTTDELISLLSTAQKGGSTPLLSEIKKKHVALAENPVPEIDTIFSKLEQLLKGVTYTKEYSDKLYALVVSRGEYLSALVLQTFVPDFSFWPAEKGIVAQGTYRNARCDFSATKKPPQKSIVTGFYGINAEGDTCLFGRGGTDYSATVVARITGAKKVEFWKDVDGFMTADPRIATSAKLIDVLSVEDAQELCRFGAMVLHPAALEPLTGSKTTIEIKNILKPDHAGTRIEQRGRGNDIVAVAGKQNQAAISVSGDAMVGSPGAAANILARISKAAIPVDVISTAQANISFTIEGENLKSALSALTDLHDFTVTPTPKLALIGVVGKGIKTDSSVSARIFSSLSNKKVHVQMVSQGVGACDFSLVVSQADYKTAVKAIHDEFF